MPRRRNAVIASPCFNCSVFFFYCASTLRLQNAFSCATFPVPFCPSRTMWTSANSANAPMTFVAFIFGAFISWVFKKMGVQRISKPAIVNFLRLCDRKRWCQPRIRYASIRSKSELCADLIDYFQFQLTDKVITISPHKEIRGFPQIQYDLKVRSFLVDGLRHDFAKVSRQKPTFHLEHRTVTLVFGSLHLHSKNSGTAAAVALMFP